MNNRRLTQVIFAGTLIMCLATCGEKEQPANQDQVFDAYLQLKRIPIDNPDRVAVAKQEYEERGAITAAIENKNYLDTSLLDAEIEEYKRELLISRYFEKYLMENVTEQNVKNYYNANQDRFESEKVRVSHILIRTNNKMSENERNALRSKAYEAYSKLQSGEAFEEVVLAYSEDRNSAKKQGDLGWLQKGAIDPMFSQKIFSMQEGDVSEPFASSFGFHIVKVVEGPKKLKQPYEQVKGDIRYQLRQEVKKAEMERLLKEAGIERGDGAGNG